MDGSGLDVVGRPVLEVTVLNRGSLVYTSQSVSFHFSLNNS